MTQDQIYRYKLRGALKSIGENIVHDGYDPIENRRVFVYQWKPTAENVQAQRDILQRFGQEMAEPGIDLFSASDNLYMVVHDVPSAENTLPKLQAEGIFTGDWPVLDVEPAQAQPAQVAPAPAPPVAEVTPEVPQTAPSPPAQSPEPLPTAGRALPIWTFVAIGIVVVLVFLLPRFLRPPPPVIPLRIAIYDWPGDLPVALAARTAGLPYKVMQKLPENFGATFPYDLLSMPLALIANDETSVHSLRDNGWRIVWVPDRSKGLEHLLVNKNYENHPELFRDKKVASLRNSFADRLAHVYLNQIQNEPYQALALHARCASFENIDTLCSALTDDENAKKYLAAVVADPYARYLVNHSRFIDISAPINEPSDHDVSILLCREGYLTHPKVKWLIKQGFSEAFNKSQGDKFKLKEMQDLGFPSFVLPEGYHDDDLLKETVREFDIVPLVRNAEFLAPEGDLSCAAGVRQFALLDSTEQASSDVCKLASTELIKQRHFTDKELGELCSKAASSVLSRGAPGLSNFDLGKSNLPDTVQRTLSTLQFESEHTYCIIGHTDSVAGDNQSIGEKRANAARDFLLGRNGEIDYFVLSVGDSDPVVKTQTKSDANRRIEIRSLPFRVNH